MESPKKLPRPRAKHSTTAASTVSTVTEAKMFPVPRVARARNIGSPLFLMTVFLIMAVDYLIPFYEIREPYDIRLLSKDPGVVVSEVNLVDKGPGASVAEVEDHWWQPLIENASTLYMPSNNTDWCVKVNASYSWSIHSIKGHTFKEFKEWKKRLAKVQPKTGIYLVKVPKAGSSTAASVTVQIAESVAAEKGFTNPCPVHPFHLYDYTERERPNFLWTIVRQPHTRSISSYFFFDVTRTPEPYNSTSLIKKLDKEKDYQLDYIYRKKNGERATKVKKESPFQKVHSVMRMYDFIAVTERMDESLAVMKLLFGFRDEALIVFSGKTNGGLDDGAHKKKCFKITRSFVEEDVKKHIAPGGEYRRKNLDYFLYAAANKSLDNTISFLGRERIESEVIRLKQLRKFAENSCLSKVTFPCQEEGSPPVKKSLESCYYRDVGCGHDCIFDVIRRNKT